ncbi:uncharacterized protein LOC129570785 [Sitodiplosis mosellana]|uniref:uncharacterized protein LOC129570785 n=1 Tax=Sitodiplosis mosellana TaxID=263140 RepID=UPI00244426CF|nr:uncharacterized protein LOC129570785 [Sitodiplosis mosellana]
MSSAAPLVHNDQSDVIIKIGENSYLSEEMADFHFKFEIADGQYERVPAHKIFLITASDVFRTMFNGTWDENDEVEIVDASVVEFKEFLQFFYLQQVKVSISNVARVMYLGNKYNIAQCLSVCERFIINTLDENNVCWAYELAIVYDQTKLKKYCETFIGINTKVVLASDNFLKSDSKVLGHILKLNTLSCSENEIFEACMNWVKATAKVDQLTREIVQAQLGELFYNIRFKSMTPQGFAALVPSYGCLLSNDEYGDISQAIALQDFQPNIFSKKPRMSFEHFSCNMLICERLVSTFYSSKPYVIQNIEKTRFSTNTPIFLLKVIADQTWKFANNTYSQIEELATEITIVQVPEPAHSGEEIVLHNEQNKIEKKERGMALTLIKPILIHPGLMYEIRLKQSPPAGCCVRALLKSVVKMGSNVIVRFHGDPTVGEDKNARGMILRLTFGEIY